MPELSSSAPDRVPPPRGRKRKIVLWIALAVLGVLFVVQLAEFLRYRADQKAFVAQQAETTAASIAGEVDSLLNRVETEGRRLGTELAALKGDQAAVEDALRRSALALSEVRGATACYEPYAFDPERRLYCPYYFKVSGEIIDVAESYDYTERGPGTAWYGGVIDAGAAWAEPYFGAGAGEWYTDFGVPLPPGPDARVPGMVDLSLEVGDFRALIHDLSIGRTTSTYILSPRNAFIVHPDPDAVGTRDVDDEIAAARGAPELLDALTALRDGQDGTVRYRDAALGDDAIVHYVRLPGSGFGVLTLMHAEALRGSQTGANRRYINLTLLIGGMLALGAALWFSRDGLQTSEIAGLSAIVSVLLLVALILIGALQHRMDRPLDADESPPLTEASTLEAMIDAERVRAETLRVDPPVPVPTGLFIERMEFADSYNVNLGGQLWQKIPSDIVDTVTPGVRFPQMSPFAEAAFVEEVYREEVQPKQGVAGHVLIGYDFRVTLRLDLSYRDYPLDQRKLDIRIAPPSHVDNVVFVPDLSAYSDTVPRSLPGIDPQIKLPGSTIEKTYFNITDEDYPTDFGYDGRGRFTDVPMLHYSIYLKRLLLNAFVTYLIPIAVVLSLIFILLMASEKTSERQGIIESMAAFFFVLVFSHIDLRKDIVTPDLMFLEYFYFITYFMIILSTFNLMAYSRSRVGWFDWRDNLLYRSVYFPIFLALLLIVMLLQFY